MNKKYIFLSILLCASLSQSILASINKFYANNNQLIYTCYEKEGLQVVELFNEPEKKHTYFGFVNSTVIFDEDAQKQFEKIKKEYVNEQFSVINPFGRKAKLLLYLLYFRKSRL